MALATFFRVSRATSPSPPPLFLSRIVTILLLHTKHFTTSPPPPPPPPPPTTPDASQFLPFFSKILLQHGPWDLSKETLLQPLIPLLSPSLVHNAIRLPIPVGTAVGFFIWAGRQETYRHSANAYNNMFRRLSVTPQADAAELHSSMCQLVEDMTRRGLALDARMISTLICSYGHVGMLAEAVEIFNAMGDGGFVPKRVSCSTLIWSALANDQLEMAFVMHEQMIGNAGLVVDQPVFDELIHRLNGARDGEKVLSAFYARKACGGSIQRAVYGAAVNTLLMAERDEEALEIFEECSKKNGVYSVRLPSDSWVMLSHQRKTNLLLKLIDILNRNSRTCDLSALRSLINELHNGRVDGHLKLCLKKIEEGSWPAFLWQLLANLICGSKISEDYPGQTLVDFIHGVRGLPSITVHINILRKFVRYQVQCGKFLEAAKLIDFMRDNDLEPCYELLTELEGSDRPQELMKASG